MNYRLRITGFAKTALLVLAATAVSCIEPLELQPDIEGTITAFEVEDQTRTTINLSTRTVNIELKTTERLYPELPEKLIPLAREYSMEKRVLYSSFNHYSLQAIKQLDLSAKTGLLYQLGMVDPWVYANYVGAYAIHPHYFVIAALPETVTRCHENGIKVNVWTVDDPQAIDLMLKCGVDGIITNKPDAAISRRDNFTREES